MKTNELTKKDGERAKRSIATEVRLLPAPPKLPSEGGFPLRSHSDGRGEGQGLSSRSFRAKADEVRVPSSLDVRCSMLDVRCSRFVGRPPRNKIARIAPMNPKMRKCLIINDRTLRFMGRGIEL